MKLVKSIVRPNKVDEVREALGRLNIAGMTVTDVRGHGRQKGHTAVYRGKEYARDLVDCSIENHSRPEPSTSRFEVNRPLPVPPAAASGGYFFAGIRPDPSSTHGVRHRSLGPKQVVRR
jgi:hypothetical protein